MASKDVLSAEEVCQLTVKRLGRPIDVSTLYRWVRRGRFPQPSVKIGFTLKRWEREQAIAAMKKIMGEP